MKIDHIAMYVKDLEGAKRFFERYFSAAAGGLYYNEKTGFRSYFLTFGDGARLEIMNKPNLEDVEKNCKEQVTSILRSAWEAKKRSIP